MKGLESSLWPTLIFLIEFFGSPLFWLFFSKGFFVGHLPPSAKGYVCGMVGKMEKMVKYVN